MAKNNPQGSEGRYAAAAQRVQECQWTVQQLGKALEYGGDVANTQPAAAPILKYEFAISLILRGFGPAVMHVCAHGPTDPAPMFPSRSRW